MLFTQPDTSTWQNSVHTQIIIENLSYNYFFVQYRKRNDFIKMKSKGRDNSPGVIQGVQQTQVGRTEVHPCRNRMFFRPSSPFKMVHSPVSGAGFFMYYPRRIIAEPWLKASVHTHVPTRRGWKTIAGDIDMPVGVASLMRDPFFRHYWIARRESGYSRWWK